MASVDSDARRSIPLEIACRAIVSLATRMTRIHCDIRTYCRHDTAIYRALLFWLKHVSLDRLVEKFKGNAHEEERTAMHDGANMAGWIEKPSCSTGIATKQAIVRAQFSRKCDSSTWVGFVWLLVPGERALLHGWHKDQPVLVISYLFFYYFFCMAGKGLI
jgi:hypothetical protein